MHYGGRAAVSVQKDHGVVVMPPPAAAARGQQQSTAGQHQPAARGSRARAAQVQLDRVTRALSLRRVGLTQSLVAAVAQVVLVGQLAAVLANTASSTVAAALAADSQSPSSREGSREVLTTWQQQQGELQTGWRAQRGGIWRQKVTAQQQRVQMAVRQSRARDSNNSSRVSCHNHRHRYVRRKQQQQKAQT